MQPDGPIFNQREGYFAGCDELFGPDGFDGCMPVLGCDGELDGFAPEPVVCWFGVQLAFCCPFLAASHCAMVA